MHASNQFFRAPFMKQLVTENKCIKSILVTCNLITSTKNFQQIMSYEVLSRSEMLISEYAGT